MIRADVNAVRVDSGLSEDSRAATRHYPKSDDNVCSKPFLSQEQRNFGRCVRRA